jgi:hypothetical protein
MDQRLPVHFRLGGFRQLDLNLSVADRDAINQVTNIDLRYGAVRGQCANGDPALLLSPCRAACET